MPKDLFGRVVAVKSPLLDEGGWLATMWSVAIDVDEAAVEAVRAQGGVLSDDEALVVGPLEPDAIERLALSPGRATCLP